MRITPTDLGQVHTRVSYPQRLAGRERPDNHCAGEPLTQSKLKRL
jgi:hypothetical protein